VYLVTVMALLCVGLILPAGNVFAQGIDFDQIDKFQSLGTSTLHVGDPPKTIVDDDERHVVILTIWDTDAQMKSIGNRLIPKTCELPLFPIGAFRPFQLSAFSDLRLSASRIIGSNTGMFCSASESNVLS